MSDMFCLFLFLFLSITTFSFFYISMSFFLSLCLALSLSPLSSVVPFYLSLSPFRFPCPTLVSLVPLTLLSSSFIPIISTSFFIFHISQHITITLPLYLLFSHFIPSLSHSTAHRKWKIFISQSAFCTSTSLKSKDRKKTCWYLLLLEKPRKWFFSPAN